jgi:hypothetical protein
LPESAGLTAVTVSGGVGAVALEIPPGVAADIHVSGDIGNREVDQVRVWPFGRGHYRSFDYGTTANRVELRATLGVGPVDRQIVAKTTAIAGTPTFSVAGSIWVRRVDASDSGVRQPIRR